MSLYSPDANSSAAIASMQAASGDCFITVLGELEIANAMQLRVFRKELSAGQALSCWNNFESDIRDGVFYLRPLSDQIFERARQLSRQTTARLGTRTADLLHVASALELDADSLYTFDQQQRKLAHAVHLKLN